MGGHRHDGAGAVAQEHVIGNPDGHLGSVQSIYTIRPRKDAVLFLLRGQPLYFALAARLRNVVLHLGFIFRGSYLFHQRVFRCQYHESNAVRGIRAGGKHPYLLFFNAGLVQSERYLRALASAYPVTLHYLDTLGPVYVVELCQLVGVLRDAEEPLLQVAPDDGSIAALAQVLPYYLLVSQHRLAVGAPVNGSLGAVSQPLLEEFQEEPLRPPIIVRQARNDFPVPVVNGADGLELLTHVIDIVHRPFKRMDTALDSGVLRRQPEGVESHRVEHVEAPHPLVAGVGVRRRHGIPVADMQVAGGVGKHGKDVPLGAGVVVMYLVEAVLFPLSLPLFFNFLCVIPVCHV